MTCSMLSIWLVNMPQDVCLGRQFDSCRLFRQTTCFMLYNMLYMLCIVKQTTCFMHAVLLATALAVCCLIKQAACCRQHAVDNIQNAVCCLIRQMTYSILSILSCFMLSYQIDNLCNTQYLPIWQDTMLRAMYKARQHTFYFCLFGQTMICMLSLFLTQTY